MGQERATTPPPRPRAARRRRVAPLLAAARRDLLLLALLAVATLAIAHRFDLFEHLWTWSRRWERFEADELLGVALVIAVALAAVAWRRWRDLRRTAAAYRLALAELRDSEARFRAIFEGAAIGIGLADLERRPLMVNPALARFTGRDGRAPGEHGFARSTHPEDAARDAALFAELVAGRVDHYQLEKRYRRADGAVAWGRLTTSLVRGEDGAPRYVVGMVEDITARVAAEAALREREARYRAVVAQAAEGIFLFDAATKRIVEANPAFCALLGYAEAELAALTLYDVVAHDRASVDANTDRVVAEGHRPTGERDYRRKDNSVVSVEVSAAALRADGAALLCVVVRDITARRAAEAALQASEAKLQAVVRSAPVLFFTLDAAGVTTFAAGRGLAALGHTPEGVIGWSAFADRPRDPAVPGYVRRALAGETVEARVAAGEIVFDTRYAPLRDPTGAITGVIGVATDVTDRVRAEAARDEAQRRLAASREAERLRLARELHDGPVQDLIAARYRLTAPGQRADTAAIADRLVDVIGALRSLIAELRPAGLDEFGLPAALKEYAAQLAREAGADGPAIDLDLDPGGGLAPPTAACLCRVAQEALRNALRHAGARHIRVSLRLGPQEATLRVEDDGCGFAIPPRLTTLAQGHHFGLIGLAERVAWAEGRLEISSAPGAGTTITARVPRWGEEASDG